MKPIIFTNKNQQIFGILHRPEGKQGNIPLVVLSHGWSGNHLGTWNAFFAKAANSMADAGFAVFRFDFRGSGNSEGKFEDQTMSSMLSDLKVVIQGLAKVPGIDENRIGLIGYSQGAYVSIFYAGKDPRVKTLISWMGMISDYKDFAPKAFLDEAKRKGFLQFAEGYTTQYDTYITDSMKYTAADVLRKLKIPLGLLYGEADDTIPISEGEKAKKFLKGRAALKVVKNLSHDFSGREGIQDEVIEITIKWLNKWL